MQSNYHNIGIRGGMTDMVNFKDYKYVDLGLERTQCSQYIFLFFSGTRR